MNDIECALSGVVPTDDELDSTEDFTGPAADLPSGWLQITITSRYDNPAFLDVQTTKAGLAQTILATIPEADRVESAEAVRLQLEAQFAALENRKEYAETLLDSETLFIAPPTRVRGLEDELKKLFKMLGIEPLGLEDDEEEEEEGEGKEEENEAPEAPGEGKSPNMTERVGEKSPSNVQSPTAA